MYRHMYSICIKEGVSVSIYLSTYLSIYLSIYKINVFFSFYQRNNGNKYGIIYLECKEKFPIAQVLDDLQK